jgi:hypothetical protein
MPLLVKERADVTAAFGYDWHQISVLCAVTVSGIYPLQSRQNAVGIGGRVEARVWR